MKKFLGFVIILFLIISTFYYTDKLSKYIIYKSSLMQQIQKEMPNYETKPVDAIISGSYIIPGLYGESINEIESYYNMRKYNNFVKNKIVFNKIKPKVSINDYKNYIIKSGNSNKNAVSILIKNNKEIINYSNKLDVTFLVDNKSFDYKNVHEQININYDNINLLDEKLNKYNKNKNIYIYSDKLKNFNDNFVVKPNITINNTNISLKNDIKSGDIIFISDDLTLDNYKILLLTLNFKNLKVLSLSKLISENNY